MKFKYFWCFLGLFLITASSVQAKKSRKKLKTNFILVEAYTQKISPGIAHAPLQNGIHFIIVWEGPKYPETFFWRGDNGWLTCNMVKVHKITNRTVNTPAGLDYVAQKVTAGAISKGDTLQLNPVAGGKFPIPDEIPKDAVNTLFYKTGGSGWLAFPVKTIGRKPDIAMP